MAAFWKKGKTPTEDRKSNRTWIYRGFAVSLIVAFLFMASYGIFHSEVEELKVVDLEAENNIGWLYQNTYMLYRELYNRENQVQVSYADLYLEPDEGYQWILDSNRLQRYVTYGEFGEYDAAMEVPYVEENLSDIDWSESEELRTEIELFHAAMNNMEQELGMLNSLYSYYVRDDKTGYYITNMSEEELTSYQSDSSFYLSFTFDGAGNVSVGNDLKGNDLSALRMSAVQAVKDTMRLNRFMDVFDTYGTVKGPVDCTVTYVISAQNMNNFSAYHVSSKGYGDGRGNTLNYYNAWYHTGALTWLYVDAGLGGFLVLISLCVAVLGFFLPIPGCTVLNAGKLRSLPLEFLVIIGFALMAVESGVMDLCAIVADGIPGWFRSLFWNGVWKIDYLWILANLLTLILCFFVAWYIGVCARALRELGIKEYIKQRSLIYRFFPFMKRKIKGVYSYFTHIDLTKKANKTIVKLLVVNALILSVISALWLGGLMVTVIYSVVLYMILRKYVSDLQGKYGILLKAVDEMAEGNLNVAIEEDLGVFEPFKPQVIKIQNGFKKAVDEEVKSQRMKAELITNVSHDLKTPLTAIITYVNLLKDENLTEEKRWEYLDTLERKSLRLKALIEDLFEVSKANTRNVTLDLMPVDIMNLIKQVSFEMKDKLDENELDVRMNLTDEKVVLSLDSQKTYRIYENLFGNIAKYALRGTRVYINGFRIDDTVVITMKNISAQEITVDSTELTERFVRGDVSRNTEGSGLGLAIAKSFTELQGGELQLEVDGDLFKATTIWKV